MSDFVERVEEVDEIRSGHELYHDDVSLTVTFDHLNEPQAIALMSMFESWRTHARFGSSRWSSFLVDGDGPFHPNIDIEASDDVIQHDAFKNVAEVEDNMFNSSAVTGKFIDYALDLEEDNE